MSKISIIIPTYNEAENISFLLQHLVASSKACNIAEIIIADGGSTDATTQEVSRFSSVRCITSKKGRPIQMNTGAKHATGTILYFLHADSYPPKDFDTYIINTVKKHKHAGCFRMKFDSKHWWLKLAGWLTALPIKASRGGDQSLFITNQLFDEVGGFDEKFIIYEDNELIKKLYKQHSFTVIPKWLTTSARCYEKHGIWTTQYHFWRIHLKRKLGESPEQLIKYYHEKLVNN